MNTPEQIIYRYLAGKDANRPAQFDHCFSEHAKVQIRSGTDAVSLPGSLNGRDEISQALARDFARTYENIFTFCVGQKPAPHLQAFNCPWIVAMTVKDDQTGRLGWGHYQWQFKPQEAGLCSELIIRIDNMLILPRDDGPRLIRWAMALPYPWCTDNDLANPLSATSATVEPFNRWVSQIGRN